MGLQGSIMQQSEMSETAPPTPVPNPALRQLDKMVGTWELKGRDFETGGPITGRMSFEWLDGGFFLLQRVDIDHVGQRVKGIEVIGYERKFGAEEASPDCTSHFFDNMGNSLDYVYDVTDDSITIWGGERGSPAHFKGRFSEDRRKISGAWEWPGGGYEATMTKVR